MDLGCDAKAQVRQAKQKAPKVQVSRETFNAIRAKAAAKKASRTEKAKTLWPDHAPKPPRMPYKRSGVSRAVKRKQTLPAKRQPQKTKPIASFSSRKRLKDQIVRLLGLLDRKINGPMCRLAHLCPRFMGADGIGYHHGEVAYHLVPQGRGDAARFLPENIIWVCSAGNYGEFRNRSLYREKHLELFGWDRIEAIEEVAKTYADYSMADLLEKRAQVKALLEKP